VAVPVSEVHRIRLDAAFKLFVHAPGPRQIPPPDPVQAAPPHDGGGGNESVTDARQIRHRGAILGTMPALPQTPPEALDADPFVLDEKRDNARARLAELRPEFTAEDWPRVAREQLLHWLKWVRLYEPLAPHFTAQPKNHRLGRRAVFAGFFCYEPEDSDRYAEVPLLMALLEGDARVARQAADALGVPLADALLQGPFPPFDKPLDLEEGWR